jgi:uncharacterized protein (TIGR03382 family)
VHAPLLTLLLSTLSPEIPLSAPTLEPTDTVSEVAVATSAQVALAAWYDDRITPGVYLGTMTRAGVVARPMGTLLDANGYHPSVAFDGTNFLVTWFSTTGSSTGTLRAVRFDATGQRLDVTPVQVASNVSISRLVSTFDGTQFVLAWTTSTFSGPLLALRVSTAGQAIDAAPLSVETGAGSTEPDAVDIASAGGVTLITWRNSGVTVYPVRGRRLQGDGTFVDAQPLQLLSSDFNTLGRVCDLATDGTSFALACVRSNTSFMRDLVLLPVPTSGAPGSVVVVDTTSLSKPVALSPRAGAWLVYVQQSTSLERFTVAGTQVTGPELLPLPRMTIPRELVPLWNEAVLQQGYTLLVHSFDAAFSQVTQMVSLAQTAPQQQSVTFASNGTVGLAAWVHQRTGGNSTLHATRVSENGVVLDSPPLALSTESTSSPVVAWDGTRFVLAWSENHLDGGFDVMVSHVELDGGRDAPAVVRGGPNHQLDPRLAIAGGQLMVCWRERDTNFAVLGAACQLAGQGPLLTVDGGAFTSDLAVASDGQRFLLVSAYEPISTMGRAVNLNLISTAGTWQGPTRRLSVPIVSTRAVFAKAGADGFLVGSQDSFDSRLGLHRVRVSPDGGLDAGAEVASVSLSSGLTLDGVVFHGNEWWLSLSATRLGTARDVMGWRLDGVTGAPTTAQLQVLVSNPEEELAGPLASLGSSVGVTYVRDDADPVLQSRRAKLRLWGDGAAAMASCTLDGECVSNQCGSGGLCCPAGCAFGCAMGQCVAAPVDAGMDAGLDAGVDAGAIDAGVDAGAVDAGVDAGVADAGAVDAGVVEPDAGAPDAGAEDAGFVVDAGMMTGGGDGATGGGGGGMITAPSGCGCASFDGMALLPLALAWWSRRRRC